MQPSQEAFNMNLSKLEAQWDPINVVRFCLLQASILKLPRGLLRSCEFRAIC